MQRVFSGIQPSGELTLGNYLGAIRNFVQLQREADCYFCVVDLHALTVPQEPEELRRRSLDIARFYVASGIDPEVATIFIQSHVTQHAELGWLLQCFSYMGELGRMTQFKNKSAGQPHVSAGLFTYPSLMAADILLYDTDKVPVGEDQKQHLELTRDIAQRINGRLGDVFKVPEPVISNRNSGGRIMSLTDPTRKMGKSEDPKGTIALLDSPAVIRKKIMSAVTDSGREVRYDEAEKPAVSNLMVIFSLCSGKTPEEIEQEYVGRGYGDFKKDLAEIVVNTIEPIQSRYRELSAPGVIEAILAKGRRRAEPVAKNVLERFHSKLGLVERLG